MNNKLNHIRSSKSGLVVSGILTIITLITLVSVSQAQANEYPNILSGQNMTIGSTGQGVVVLQGLMSELGYLNVPSGIPFGYYGSLTKDAVTRYQSSRNVSPSVGYYGPVTKNAMYNDFSGHGWLSMLGW